MNTVLVTGGAGDVGDELPTHSHLRVIQRDIRDTERFREAMR